MIAHQICLDLSWESSQESFPELLLETEEQILIGQCLKGDRVAQKKLYENHFHDLYAICMRYAKNTDDAKDVLQDGFVKIFGKLKSYTGEGSFNGWMKLVMVHTALDFYRKQKREATVSYELESDDRVECDIEENISVKEILELINKLPDMQRLVFNLYILEDYTHRDIAKELNISEGTSKWYLCEARKTMKKLIEKMYPNNSNELVYEKRHR